VAPFGEASRRGLSPRRFTGYPSMTDFLVALGLVFVIEGLIFAASPSAAKNAMAHVLETPDNVLRVVGIVSAAIGVILVWFMRG
jgi:uncharacterized protein YjeT (DUF2065 family)